MDIMFRIKQTILSKLSFGILTTSFLIGFGSGVLAQAPAAVKETSFTPAQVTEIKSVVHDYLISNPKLLLEMSKSLQDMREKEVTQTQEQTKGLIGAHSSALYDASKHPMIGNAKGDVVMAEVFDYQCGHCKIMDATIIKLTKDDPNLQIFFVEWPIFGPNSAYATKAALAANKQGKYLDMHEALLRSTTPLNQDSILAMAKGINGLDIEKLQKDIADPAMDDAIKANFKIAADLKLLGTPSFLISNRDFTKFAFIPGESDEKGLREAIASVRVKATTATSDKK
jgi:protein-disulfide isomerase